MPSCAWASHGFSTLSIAIQSVWDASSTSQSYSSLFVVGFSYFCYAVIFFMFCLPDFFGVGRVGVYWGGGGAGIKYFLPHMKEKVMGRITSTR